MKKRTLKKIITAFISAVCVGTFGIGAAGCMPKSIDKTEPEGKNVWNDRLAPPTDGSLPTAYSCVENLAYIVGKFDTQTQYHAYTEGVTSASIATQTTRNWKDYKDGVLMSSDITYSSMVKGGTQMCTVFREDEEGKKVGDTYFRTSETPVQDTTSTSAVWSQEAPKYFDEKSYLFTYGFLPSELFNYAVNSETIISSEEIKVESNGTYTLKFTLDPKGSTFYYQFGMKTRGGLSDYPDFQFIEITVNFNADWQINSSYVHEVSNVNKGIVVKSVSDFTAIYYYGDDHFDNVHYGYYEKYFKNYVGDDNLEAGGNKDEELILDVTNVLSNGFANILNGGQQFEISADLGNNRYVGYVYLSLNLEDIAGSINLKLSLGKSLDRQELYVEYAGGELAAYYGNNFAIEANLAKVKLEAEKFGEVIQRITSAINPSKHDGSALFAEGGEENDPLTDLMNSMVLTAGTNEAVLTLDTDDLLGLGIGINANLVFGISGKTITFRGADICDLAIGGEVLGVKVGLKTTTASLIYHDRSETPADLADYVADIHSLLASDLIKVTATLNGDSELVNISALKGLNVQVDAYADLGGIAVGADASVSYTYNGSTISAKLNVIYEYNAQTGKYGKAYLGLTELNGKAYDFKVKCDIEQLVTGVSALLNTAGATDGVATGNLVSILSGALSADFSSLLTEMYADGLKIKISIGIDAVLNMLGVDAGVSFGSCELVYARGAEVYGGNLSVALPAIGFGMNVCGTSGELPAPNDKDYLDLADLIGDVADLLKAKAVAVGLSFDGTALNIDGLTANATAYVDFDNKIIASVVAGVKYGNISANVTVDYVYNANTYGTAVLTLNELCGVERNVKLYCNINEVIDGVKTLLTHFGTPATQAAAEGTNGVNLSDILTNLLTADINAIIPNLEAKTNVLNLTVNVDEVLKLLNVNAGVTVGNVSLNYTHGGENLLTAEAPAFGVTATVNPYNGVILSPSIVGALNLKDVLDDVNSIINAGKLAVDLSFNGTALNIENLTANATAYVDINSGIVANVVANVTYGKITAKITAEYIYEANTYGTAVLTLNELCGVERNVKLYCNINEVITGVKTLLTHFGTPATQAAAEGTNGVNLSELLSKLLTADINAIIPNLEAKTNVLNLTVNVDEVLKLLNVNAGITVGNVSLNYTHGGENLLTASAPNFGVTATVNPYDGEVTAPTTDGALNLKDVLDDVNAILNSKKLAVELGFNGTALNKNNLTATATAYVDINSGIVANVVANVTYGKITAKITAEYIYEANTYGTAVLTLNELCGVERNVKLYCNINEVIDGVKTLLTHFGAPATQAVEEGASNGINLSELLSKLLTADINAIIPNLEAKTNVFNLTVNVDEALKLLNVNAGITVGNVSLNYTHGGGKLLVASAPNFGVTATVNPYNGEVTAPTTDGALNLKDVLDDVNSIITAGKLEVELGFNGTALNINDLTATATAYVDINSGIVANVVANVTYGKITAKITAEYIYEANTYGTAVLTLNELCGVERNVKLYCNINEVITGVKTLLTHFGTPTTQAVEEGATSGINLSDILAKLLTADINAIIPNLEAKTNVLNLTVNVDEVLNLVGVNAGITVGNVSLNYTHGSENLLTAEAPAFGVTATVNPYNGEVTAPTTNGALNLKDVLDDVNAILNSKKLAVELGVDGTALNIENLTATATAYVDINSGVVANVVANVTYGNITAKITAEYIYEASTYGTAVLTLNELCGVERNVKLYCNINEVITGVKSLLTHFGTPATQAAEEGATSGINLSDILSKLLTADINAIIPNLEAKTNVLNLTLNVDEVLKLLNVNAGVTVGNVSLNYTYGGGNLLVASAPNFGVTATVNPYNGEVTAPTTDGALNLKDVLDDVNAILNSKKLAVELGFNGKALNINDLTATATAYVDINSGIVANVVANVTYGNITAKITAEYIYEVNTYGTAVLTLNELCGVERNVKLYCNINEVIDGVKTLLTHFGTPATQAAEEGATSGINLSDILSKLLTADINAIIPNLEAKTSVLNLTVNVDEVLKLLNVNAGVTVGNVSLNYTHDGENLLAAGAPAFGVTATVNPYNGEVTAPTTDGALNLKDVLDDVNAILNSKKLAVELGFNGKALNINDLTATATAYVDINSGIVANVVANVTYGKITAKITAEYIYETNTYGTAVLTLNELCGVERNVKLYCNINEVIDGVKTLLTHFGTPATQAAAEGTNGVNLSDILAKLLTADINAIIPNLEAKTNVLNLTVNVDEVLKLLNVNAGITVGNVSLNYTHGGENLLTAEAPAFGVTATVNPYNGEVTAPTTDSALNLKDVLDDVNAILNTKTVAVKLGFNGSALNIAAIKDLTATATAYVDFNTGLAAKAVASLNYKIDEQTAITAQFTLYYSYEQATYGDVILSLDSLNGVATSIKVNCKISELKTAIETLINYVAPKNGTLAETGTGTENTPTKEAANVLDKLLTADLSKVITELNSGENVLNITLNADEILNIFEVNLGFAIGDVALTYTHPAASTEGETEKVDMLSATVSKFGVTLGVNPTDQTFEIPTTDGCLDLTKLVDTVNGAMAQINAIKEQGKIRFEIAEVATDSTPATYLYLDGIRVQVWGKGEVCWTAGSEYVALDLSMSISESGTDVTTVKFVYNKNGSPMVKLALNNVGLTIYNNDIESVKKGFVEIYNKLAGLLGLEPIEVTAPGQGTEQTTPAEGTQTDGTQTGGTQPDGTTKESADKLIAVILKTLAKSDWVSALSDFTAMSDGQSVALKYLTDSNSANLKIGVNGGLTLEYNGAFGERFKLGGVAKVTVPAERLTVDFSGLNMASSADGETEFMRLAYNFLFDCIHSISVENILGSNTYEVHFVLNGANTDIADLQDVFVNAEIYVTGGVSESQGKLAEGLLNLDVAGVAINLHVISDYDANGKARFYINLTRVGDILLPDLKLYATQDSLYETFKVLFETVTKTDIVEAITKLLPSSGDSATGVTNGAEQPADGTQTGGTQVTEGKLDKLASLLDKLLNFDFNSIVEATEENGVTYANIDLNNIMSQLGVNVGGDLGKLSVEINHNNHSMTTSGVSNIVGENGVKEEREWISLASAKTDRRSYETFKREDYLNIEFLPYLIDDVRKTATDDSGKMYDKFTFSGNIEASIVSMFNIKIDVRALTVSLADNDFYFSAVLHVQKMSALSIVTIPESTVGISYHGGYITLARGLDSATPEYRIMTLDFFVDHMLVKNAEDSVLKWWLNVSGWDTVIKIINKAAPDLNVSSGLTTTQDVYLYKKHTEGTTQLISMYDYVDALRVAVNGNEYAAFGDMSDLENEFGISDNYYGFKLNAKKVTGDVLTKLYAAITRNANGISTVKASGAIQSYVTFNATLNYEEGLKDTYVIGNAATDKLNAPSMFTAATAAVGGKDKIDFTHFERKPDLGYDEKFGCITIANNGNGYEPTYQYSNVLYSHVLTVVDLDGKKTERNVRHGSTVYLYDNDSPVYTDESKEFRLLYTTEKNVLGAPSVVMNGDMTVYAYKIKAVTIVMYSGEAEYMIHSFVGDKVPTTVDGRETIGEVTYEGGEVVGENDKVADVEGISVLNLKGTFVQSLVDLDGVNYKFIYDNETATGHYEIVSLAESFDTTLYCGENAQTLVLRDMIDGYPVTKIGNNAFENTNGHSIKSVIVPATITTVGTNAFLNNVGMEKVVFLAPEVTMEGTFSEGEDGNTTPFYGCTSTADSNNTNLTVYYNTIYYRGSASDLLWTRIKRTEGGAMHYRYYIGCDPRDTAIVDYDKNGGGKLVSGGGWSIVNLEVKADCVDDEVSVAELASANVIAGLREGVYTQADGKALEDKLTEALSAYTGAYGAKYVVNVNVTNYYGDVTVTVTVSLNEPVTVTVSSKVGIKYVMGGMTQTTAGDGTLDVIKTENGVVLYAPEATVEGYFFLGWAMNKNGTLTFIDGNNAPYGEGCVYYAIWGTSKVGTAFKINGVATSGTALPAASGEGIDCKWYDNSWNEVSEISLENTIVYTRSVFDLTVKLEKKAAHTNMLHVGAQTSRADMSATTSITTKIYEGALTISINSDKNVITVINGGVTTEIYVNEMKLTWGGYQESTNKRKISYLGLQNCDVTSAKNLSVSDIS